METLSKLFGSEAKVKIIRLFLFNPERVFEAGNVAERVQAEPSKVRRELSVLEKMGLIKRRQVVKPVMKLPKKLSKSAKKKLTKKGKKNGHVFVLDTSFAYLLPLQNFLINAEPLQPREIVNKITKLGSIKLILTAGVFLQEAESRVDILIVGDGIKKGGLDMTIKTLESEIGKELKYAYFTTEDFKYRLSMYDKLTRDILDYPHKKVLNKLGIL